MKTVLVIGSGGREHAICEKFSESKKVGKIYAVPGNAGTSALAENVEGIALTDHKKISEFCRDKKIDLVFVGPEQPLVDGMVDDLKCDGITVFGPSKVAAALEGSKAFMKEIVSSAGVPTAGHKVFTNKNSAINFIKKHQSDSHVIKTDGLAAGKGVIIAKTKVEAIAAIEEMFSGKFGDAGKKIIIEEFLEGPEVSYFVIANGEEFLPLGFACDHKRALDGDAGPNTGGMGTFSPPSFISAELEQQVNSKIIKPSLAEMKRVGAPFCGILFAGLMLTKNGPKLLEFNIRFGDPETQVILPRLKSDFYDLIEAAISSFAGNERLNERKQAQNDEGNRSLSNFKIEFDDEKKLVCVVIAANGYPENYKKGETISGLELAIKNTKSNQVKIFHAGTKFDANGNLVSNGGRILNAVGIGKNFDDARQNAYRLAEEISWTGGFYRKDIAKNAK